MTRILIPVAIILLMALVGRGDYEEAQREEATYCRNVASGAWPDYRGDFTRMCAAIVRPLSRSMSLLGLIIGDDAMERNTAKQLIALLKAIDTDHPKDFINAVCEARDSLPATTGSELASLAFGCEVNPFVSRCCERGTKGCTTAHASAKGPGKLPPGPA